MSKVRRLRSLGFIASGFTAPYIEIELPLEQ